MRLWLRTVDLDAEVNGKPMAFRVQFNPTGSEVTGAAIYRGSDPSAVYSADLDAAAPAGVDMVGEAESDEELEHLVGSTMLRELGLDEMVVFTTKDDTGRLNNHGWPTYYTTVHPPAGSNEILIGPSAVGLAPRLLQIFLDLPSAALRTRVHATVESIENESAAGPRRREFESSGLAARRTSAREQLERAEAALAVLAAAVPAEDVGTLAELTAAASAANADAQGRAAAATAAAERALQERIDDQRRVNTLKESIEAGQIFHGLNPAACPRCETTITAERRKNEVATHACAVCSEPVPTADSSENEERLTVAEDALKASTAATVALEAALQRANAEVQRTKDELDALSTRLRAASAIHTAADRLAAEIQAAAARGALEALGEDTGQVPDPLDLIVLRAAEDQLNDEYNVASHAVFEDLSEEITRLATVFGIAETDRIVVKRNATMDVRKGGAPRSSFSRQSPGERLRLRYALLVALLRVAAAHKVAGHPGLLLLDSFKAEEVQEADARKLLMGLVDISNQVDGLQVIATTVDDQLVSTVYGVANTITPLENSRTLF